MLFQPVYDSYLPLIRRPAAWRASAAGAAALAARRAMLRSAFSHRTRSSCFNNPLNPAGVVYPREELEVLAGL